VPDESTLAEARAVVEKYGLQPSDEVRRHLGSETSESPKPGDPCFARVSVEIVASARTFLEAAATHLNTEGFPAHILSDSVEGDAREVARAQAFLLSEISRHGRPYRPPCALLSGGETTVTVRGDGRGGPNLEFLLALFVELGGAPRYAAMACDTDGSDGATGVAGAGLRPDTDARAARAGLEAQRFLEMSDSLTFFERLGDLVVTGPTLNNVNDFRALLVMPE
jgi:hydroxypyruvate reductase